MKKLCLTLVVCLLSVSITYASKVDEVKDVMCNIYANSVYFGCMDKRNGSVRYSSYVLLTKIIDNHVSDKHIRPLVHNVIKQGYDTGYDNNVHISCDSLQLIAKKLCKEN